MTKRKMEQAIVRAIKLLREDAQLTYDSCKGTDAAWVCGGAYCPNCNAHRDYSARIKCANQLEHYARKP